MSDIDHHDPVSDRRHLLRLGAGAALGAGALVAGTAGPSAAIVTNGAYYSATPQRVVDTRRTGGRISAGQTRTYSSLSGEQFAAVCNVTVAGTSGNAGYLTLYSAALTTRPSPFSSINWQGSNKIVANMAVFDLGAAGFKVYCGGSGATHVIVDFVGYFLRVSTARSAAQLAFEARAAEAAEALRAEE